MCSYLLFVESQECVVCGQWESCWMKVDWLSWMQRCVSSCTITVQPWRGSLTGRSDWLMNNSCCWRTKNAQVCWIHRVNIYMHHCPLSAVSFLSKNTACFILSYRCTFSAIVFCREAKDWNWDSCSNAWHETSQAVVQRQKCAHGQQIIFGSTYGWLIRVKEKLFFGLDISSRQTIIKLIMCQLFVNKRM